MKSRSAQLSAIVGPLTEYVAGAAAMSEVVRYELNEGVHVLVEVDEDDYGVEQVGRGEDGIRDAGRVVIDALESVQQAAQQTLDVLRRLAPNSLEMEFGIKLAGEAGAIIAKTSAEGHFTVKLSWEAEGTAG